MSKSDIQIAREAKMKPIQEILDGVGVPDKAEAYSPISRYIAKIKLEHLEKFKDKKSPASEAGFFICMSKFKPSFPIYH